MKGIALETIAYFMIALVTIILIFMLVGTKITPAIKNAYCSFVRGIRLILPLPNYMRPPLPTYCEKNATIYLQTKFIDSDQPDTIESLIASHVIACWEMTGKLNIGQNILCFELVLKNKPTGDVGRDNVEEKISSEYSEYSNIMNWRTDDPITEKKSIGITYNSTNKEIEVV
jgi:hypothetical protein